MRPLAIGAPSASATSTSQKQRLRPRRSTRARAVRSLPRAAARKSTVSPIVDPARWSGSASSAQAAAMPAVSMSVLIAPPCTTSPIVASSGRKGNTSTASSSPTWSRRSPTSPAKGEFGTNCRMISVRVGIQSVCNIQAACTSRTGHRVGGAMSRREEQTEGTRAALLAAARELFSDRGYAAVGTEEIVQRARVTRGALYHHLADKKDLFRAVHEQMEGELTTVIGAQLAAAASEDPLAGLVTGVGSF